MPKNYGSNFKEISLNNQYHKFSADKINIGTETENFVTGAELVTPLNINLIPGGEEWTTGIISGATTEEIIYAVQHNQKIIANWPGNNSVDSAMYEMTSGSFDNNAQLLRLYGTLSAPFNVDDSYRTNLSACYIRVELGGSEPSSFRVNQLMLTDDSHSVYVITLSSSEQDEYTGLCDHTFTEMTEAYSNGMHCVLMYLPNQYTQTLPMSIFEISGIVFDNNGQPKEIYASFIHAHENISGHYCLTITISDEGDSSGYANFNIEQNYIPNSPSVTDDVLIM